MSELEFGSLGFRTPSPILWLTPTPKVKSAAQQTPSVASSAWQITETPSPDWTQRMGFRTPREIQWNDDVAIPKKPTAYIPADSMLECPAIKLNLQNLLGQGAYGRVFRVCDREDCEKIIKVQILRNSTAVKSFVNEVKLTKKAADGDYAPRVFFACLTDGKRIVDLLGPKALEGFKDIGENPQVGIIVQEKWDGSIENLQPWQWCDEDNYARLLSKVQQMHLDGITHADLLPKNVLYKMQNGLVVDLMPTDFGLSFERGNRPSQSWLETLWDYHYNKPEQPTAPAIASTWLKNVQADDVEANPDLLDEPLLQMMRIGCPTTTEPTVQSVPARSTRPSPLATKAQSI